MEKNIKRICVYTYMSHFAVQQKLTQHCKSTIFEYLKKKNEKIQKTKGQGTSLVVQWLRVPAPNAGGPDSIPAHRARSHVPQLTIRMPQLKILPQRSKIPCGKAKNWHSQIHK